MHGPVPVYLAHPDDPDLDGADAITLLEKGVILVNRDLGAHEKPEALMHEILHEIERRTSLAFKLAGETKTSIDAWAADHGHTETMVRTLSPALVGLATAGKNGYKLLRLPKPPKEKKK